MRVSRTTIVYLYIGSCNNKGILNVQLLNSDSKVVATYSYRSDSEACQWTAIASLDIPASPGEGDRILQGSWAQQEPDHEGHDTNIQFHAIAVDAGGPLARKNNTISCARGSSGKVGGTVILQAASLRRLR